MDPVEALGSGAQIATALAGFTGVVVVFGSGAVHQWPAIDRFRLQLMLTSSVLPLVLCLLGMLVLSAAPTSDGTWRWCSGLTAAFLLLGGLFNTRTFLAFPTGAFEAVGGSRLTFIAVAAMGIAVCALQVWNLLALGAFWPFFAAIVMAMVSAILQFVRLIFKRPTNRPS